MLGVIVLLETTSGSPNTEAPYFLNTDFDPLNRFLRLKWAGTLGSLRQSAILIKFVEMSEKVRVAGAH